MRYLTFRSYQLSFTFLAMLILTIVSPIVIALTYLWATRTVDFTVEEPLSITDFPSAFSTHPGENKSLSITLANSANVNYSVTLVFVLNDTSFQQQYVTFSSYTYFIVPGINNVGAWLEIAKKAPPAALSLSIQFYRE